MLLTIDVGNTNITLGVFDGENLLSTMRLTTKMSRTSDEFGISLRSLLRENRIDQTQIKDAIISTVVPSVMHSLKNGLFKYFHVEPLVVGPGVKTGIKIVTENPNQIGADRVDDAV